MRYQTFGRRTGLRVSEYALGTANWGTGPSAAGREGVQRIFEAFADAGGTTIDTSNRYQGGQAETMVGDLLVGRRDEFVVITKYTSVAGDAARPGMTGNSRRTMVRSLEESLTRLKTDYVDVFLPHFPDQVTPMDEIRAGFDDLIRDGKILHGGLSNFPAWRVAGVAASSSVIGVQTEYSLVERSGEREVLPMADAHGFGVLLYSPLGGGVLTGKYRHGESGRLSVRGTSIERTAQTSAVVDEVLAIADELGVGPVQVSLAWLRHRGNRAATALIPIVGPRTPAQLAEYLRALDCELTDEQYRRLDDVSAPTLGTPHEDVAAALRHGLDGDRSLFRASPVAAI